MNKKIISFMLAGGICFSAVYSGTYIEKPAHALTVIASVTDVTVKKDVIAVGESVQLELEWSTGVKQQLYFNSSDETVATVDQNGLVTGVGNGTAIITLSHSNIGTDKTITINVSEDAESSKTYNTSELTLEAKLKKYDTLHYTGTGAGSCLNVVNTEGGYDLVYLNSEDYVLPFDAEIVGIDGLVMYVAPDIEGITYLDGRTLSVGDTIDRNTHLLCYDYHINNKVIPVFLPDYYDKYIGDGTIRVKDIDHENKTITLESVDEFDWLPATMDDYEAFIAENGNVSVHGKYIVYCDEINYSTGDEVILEQLGTAEIKKVKEYSISSDEPLPAGSPSNVVYVYEAVSSGTVAVTISHGRPWDTDSPKNVKSSDSYMIDENLSITKITKTESDDILTVSVVDYKTGEPIVTDCDVVWPITLQSGILVEYALIDGTFAWGTQWTDLESWSYGQNNPCKIDVSSVPKGFEIADFRVVDMYIPDNYFLPEDYLDIKYKESDINHTDFPSEITIKLKQTMSGDVNDDEKFNVADAVMLRKWLSNESDVKLANWKAADFNGDGMLNVFDLCMMKRELTSQK